MRAVPLDDALFGGAVSLERRDGWVKPWRIPFEDLVLFPPDGLGGTVERAAGVRLGMISTTTRIEVGILPSPAETQFDCVVDGALQGTRSLAPGERTATFAGLPQSSKRIEIFLSQRVPVRLSGVTVEDGATCAPLPADRPRWITYGSSITHCMEAASPAQTWPALVARRCGLDLTCLGLGGNCHMEPMVARLIRDLPADFISLCVGINVQGGASLSSRTFRAAVIGFVRILRDGHPQTPVAVMSPILSPPRETTRNAVGLSLVDMRGEVAEAVAALRARGDDHVHAIDGLALFGEAHVARLPDLLHPDAEGYRLLAANFVREVAGPIFGLPAV